MTRRFVTITELDDLVTSNPEAVAQIVRRQRTSMGMSQREAAEACGISRSAIQRIENAIGEWKRETVAHLLTGLGMTNHQLVRGLQDIRRDQGPLGRRIEVIDGIAHVPLFGKHGKGRVTLIDPADIPIVDQFRWKVRVGREQGNPNLYAYCNERTVLHRFLLDLSPDDPEVDHRNGDTLDNRRSNLRPCSRSQNQANRHALLPNKSSRYRGVCLRARSGRWVASIRCNKVDFCLGTFESEIDAALAYDAKARELFGEFANLNFPGHEGVSDAA